MDCIIFGLRREGGDHLPGSGCFREGDCFLEMLRIWKDRIPDVACRHRRRIELERLNWAVCSKLTEAKQLGTSRYSYSLCTTALYSTARYSDSRYSDKKNWNIEHVWCFYARYSNSQYFYWFLGILDILKIKFVLYLYQFLLVWISNILRQKIVLYLYQFWLARILKILRQKNCSTFIPIFVSINIENFERKNCSIFWQNF